MVPGSSDDLPLISEFYSCTYYFEGTLENGRCKWIWKLSSLLNLMLHTNGQINAAEIITKFLDRRRSFRSYRELLYFTNRQNSKLFAFFPFEFQEEELQSETVKNTELSSQVSELQDRLAELQKVSNYIGDKITDEFHTCMPVPYIKHKEQFKY